MRSPSRASAAVVISYFCILVVSCDDPLPPYQRPENIFREGFNFIDTALVMYTGYWDVPERFDYSTYSPWFGPIRIAPYSFVLEIENMYEETIQTNADIQGKLELWLEGHPDYRATLPLTRSNALLLNSRDVFDAATSILTLNPHQRLYLKTEWNYKLDNGKWIHEILDDYNDVTRSRSSFYRYYPPLEFHARGTVGLIKNTSFLLADSTFSFKLMGIWRMPR